MSGEDNKFKILREQERTRTEGDVNENKEQGDVRIRKRKNPSALPKIQPTVRDTAPVEPGFVLAFDKITLLQAPNGDNGANWID
jgi:hypothetical protein